MPVTLDKFPLVLTAALARVPANLGGTFIRCTEADEDFLVSFDNGPAVPLGLGRAIAPQNPDGSPQRFSHVAFIRADGAAAAANTIEVVYGNLAYFDDRLALLSGATIRNASAATLVGADPDVVLVPATQTLLLGANSDRRCARVRNNGANDARVCTDSADLIAGRGELVRPGEVLETFVTGILRGLSTAGTTLIVTEEEF